MGMLEKLEPGTELLYSDIYYSAEYNHKIYIQKSRPDTSGQTRYYLRVYTIINGKEYQQGFIYFYLNTITRSSDFIGLHIAPEYRNLNIGTLLVAAWIDLCLNNNYNFLGANEKQRKPFLTYLLKTYGFEIFDKTLYNTRNDVVAICSQKKSSSKSLLFKDPRIENRFINSHIYTNDNYNIVHDTNGITILDNIILPIECKKRDRLKYNLLDEDKAKTKTMRTLNSHKR